MLFNKKPAPGEKNWFNLSGECPYGIFNAFIPKILPCRQISGNIYYLKNVNKNVLFFWCNGFQIIYHSTCGKISHDRIVIDY